MTNTVRLKRGSGSDPSASDMVVGEPVIRTDTAELFFKKDDGSVAKVSGGGGGPDFKYLALRNAANNGSASYPGNDFTLVTSGTTNAITPAAANTLLVSYGGVIQKPNSGTSTSGITGFIVDGSRFKTAPNLAAAPDFILYQESGGIGEPSDNTVTSAKIVDGAIVNADINASAAIAGTKINPNFGSQAINTSASVACGNITISNVNPKIFFTDTDTDSDFSIRNNNGVFTFYDQTNSAARLTIASDGTTTVAQNLDVGAGVDVTGNITVTGTVDGVDIAALNTTVGTKLPLAGGTITGNVIHNDSVKAIFGTDSDFSIYHSSNTTLENETTGGHLILNNKATLGSIRLRVANGEEGIVVNPNGQVEVYCDNALKLNTHTSGVTVTGTCTATAFSGDGSNLSGVGAFPSGTKMLFQQTSAPTGWTKVTSSVDNRALRVVSGSAGSGGSVAFTTAFASQSVSGSVANTTAGGSISTNNTTAGGSVSSHTLSTSQIPSHSHSLPRGDQNWGNGNSGHNTIWGSSYIASTGSTGGGGSHNHGFSGSAHSHSGSFSGSAHNHSFSGTSINLAVQYIDVIVASKD